MRTFGPATSFRTWDLCLPQNAPGNDTLACPEVDFMGITTIPGCCKPDGTCGIVITMLAPLGCVSASAVAPALASLGVDVGAAAQRMTCSP